MDKRWEKLGKAVDRPAHHQQHQQQPGRNNYHDQTRSGLPPECLFSTFYTDTGVLKEELFYDCPKKVARLFESAQYKSSAFRNLFNAFQRFAFKLKMHDKSMPFEKAKEEFGRFYTQHVVRQNNRTDSYRNKLLPDVVLDFIDKHRDLARSSQEEMLGLFQYLTNVYCYFDGKK